MARTKEELSDLLTATSIRLHKQFGSRIETSRLQKWVEECLRVRINTFLQKTLGPLDDEDVYNLHEVVKTPTIVPGPTFTTPVKKAPPAKAKK